MNGYVSGEITLNAAIYKKAVCEVCLNCPHEDCRNVKDGCKAFRAALAANSRKYRRRKGRVGHEGQDVADGYDPACVGAGV